ncbi:hypothetical protein TIFTF001_000927 [Ficus carica]|uniref:TRUD domain-containing protein n=1 Tax=Ficus carica TaxID=3494 RepID=A0AA87Z6I3_FICCA|nr:hypothetical protein TIFTF001_000927 [Ficus carica]
MLLGIHFQTVRFADTGKRPQFQSRRNASSSSSSSSSCNSVVKPYSLCNYYYTSSIATSSLEALTAMKALEESDVGIFCYISHLPGFRGILKQRCLAGDSDAENLEALLNQISSGGAEEISPIVLSPNSDKSHRTAMHNFFKKNFKFLVTDAIDGPDASSKCIRVRLNSGGQNNKGRNSKKRKERGGKPFDSRGSDDWPEHVGKFLRFHLNKENKDSHEALGLIGKMLGIQPRSFGFAGTKDKRSVSTQRVTVFKQRASSLAALNDRLIGIKVGDFCYVKEELVLGQLSGNRFTVTLRGVVADSEDTIKASASALGRQGFINYFGLQRFGSGSVPTYLIGAMLFRGEWKAAVDMILDPREGDILVSLYSLPYAITKAREYYKETNDIDGTLRQLPRHLVAEKAILQCLKKCPGNFLQALKAIPRTLRMIDKVVVGDLVYSKENNTEKLRGIANADCKDEDSNEVFDSHDIDDVSGADLPEERNNPVKAVTAEDILAGNYTIDDAVLPLPGSRVILPTNDIAQVYHDLAKKDAISLTESAHNVKELLTYTDGTIPLAETDLDIIAKSKPEKFDEENGVNGNDERHNHSTKRSKRDDNDNGVELQTDDKEVDGERETEVQADSTCGTNSQEPQKALKLSFTLPASCYATMAIRELLKTSTSVCAYLSYNSKREI